MDVGSNITVVLTAALTFHWNWKLVGLCEICFLYHVHIKHLGAAMFTLTCVHYNTLLIDH